MTIPVINRMYNKHQTVSQKGIALVLVLWILSLLTILAAGYSHMMRTETRLTANLVHAAKASALAEAGIWYTIAELLKPQDDNQWKADGSHHMININQDTVRISIHSEAGKINLNLAQPELIEGLLRSISVPENELPALVNAILDWRDQDNSVRQEGAEDEQYKNLDYDFGAKDGPFNTIDELQLVMGITPALFKKMEPALTIYSSQPGIDIQTAPRAALLALPGQSEERVDEILATRMDSPDTDTPVELTDIDPRLLARAKGQIFTITSEGTYANSYSRLDVVIMLIKKTTLNQPYAILSWREDHARDQEELLSTTGLNTG